MRGDTVEEMLQDLREDVAAAVWLGGNVLGFITLAWLWIVA